MKQLRHGGFWISKIHQLSGRIVSKKLKSYNVEGINPAQGRILFFLWQNDGVSINELSHMTALEKSTLTSMLDRLEAAGHITRIPCRNDRRKVLIKVTNSDSTLKEAYEKSVIEMGQLYYKDFSEAEIGQFENYLKRVFDNLSEYEKNS